MIIVRLWGGLGNQLFQYSFGQYIEGRGRQKVVYDIASFGTSDQLRKLEICSLIPDLPLKNVRFTEYTGLKNRLYRLLFQCVNSYLTEKEFNIKFLENAKGTFFLQGYWQDKIYAEFFPRQRVIDKWKTPESLVTTESAIRSADTPVSLHVRRGDYFSSKNIGIYGVCTEEYYEQAINRVELAIKGNKSFFVFSDDLQWVKDHISLPMSTVFVSNYEVPQFAYIYLMSLCKVNIISNSTFSWWGAYLNRCVDKLVIAPSRWIFTSNETLALDNWIKI